MRIATIKIAKARTLVGVPMLKDNEVVGIIAIYRQEVRAFTDKQIELVTTFADQAVIAIENVRLFEAEQQRTRELSESLEQQTATSEVLQVISSSPGDLQPVFETMLENAVRICDAKFGNIYRWDGDALHFIATENTPTAFTEARRRLPTGRCLQLFAKAEYQLLRRVRPLGVGHEIETSRFGQVRYAYKVGPGLRFLERRSHHQCDRFAVMADFRTGESWTGAPVRQRARLITGALSLGVLMGEDGTHSR